MFHALFCFLVLLPPSQLTAVLRGCQHSTNSFTLHLVRWPKNKILLYKFNMDHRVPHISTQNRCGRIRNIWTSPHLLQFLRQMFTFTHITKESWEHMNMHWADRRALVEERALSEVAAAQPGQHTATTCPSISKHLFKTEVSLRPKSARTHPTHTSMWCSI